ncbi:MAG TPA: hypothetical protein PLJ35_03345 [Anaerolineae bacterium]|nr:hypothetical protein [Anaerolineae bacterium]HPL27125.1 hypothetical protein [Anaerolineae bacterium]
MATTRLPLVVWVSRRLYGLLLWLCPAQYRREYGPSMRQAFSDLAREAYARHGACGVLALWLRAFPDLVATATREHLAAFSYGGGIMLEDRPCTPRPWWQVGLAVLPGLLVIVGDWRQPRLLAGLASSRGHSLPLLALAVLLVAAGLVWRRRVPPWALPALGLLFGVAVAGPYFLLLGLPGALAAVAYLAAHGLRRRGLPARAWALLAACLCLSLLPALGAALGLPFLARSFGWLGWLSPWSTLGVGATLLVAFVALPLARPHGLPAGLLLLATGFALWEQTFDLMYGLARTLWGNTMLAVLAALLLVVAPLWVLRARSLHGQARGLLVPAAAALAGVVAIDTIVRTDPAILEGLLHRAVALDEVLGISYGSSGPALLAPFLLRNGLAVLQLLLALLLAVVLFARAQAAGALREEEA